MTSSSFCRRSRTLFLVLTMTIPIMCPAAQTPPETEAPAADAQLQDTLSALNSLLNLQSQMKADMDALGKQLSAARTGTERNDIQA